MRNYKSTTTQKTLATGINTTATQMTLDSVTNIPNYPFTFVLDPDTATEEIVTVTGSAGGNALYITRAEDGSAAYDHSAGAVIKHMVTARDLQEPQNHIAATTGVHGITGSLASAANLTTHTSATTGVHGVTGALAAASDLAAKAPLASPTFTGTVVLPSDTSIGDVSAAEVGYLNGVTSAIQTQFAAVDAIKINGKRIYVSATEPSAPSGGWAVGDVWIDI